MNRTAAAIAAVFLLISAPAFAGPRDLVVVRPGGAAPSEESQTQISRLLVELSKRAGWAQPGKASYFNAADEAVQAIRTGKPGFVLTTPGFFLAHREALGLTPINQILVGGKDVNRYYVVVKKGTLGALDALKGKKLAGAPLSEAAFVERIVLARKFKFGKDVTAEYARGLTALRRLSEGAVDAVVIDEKEKEALPSLPFAADLTVLFTSQPLPNTGLMSVRGVTKPEDVAALGKAIKGFCDAGEGKAICETYGITGFRAAPPGVFDALIKAYAQP
jgi:hypothetical protein